MSYWILSMPVIYLTIVGFEYVFLKQRFYKIRNQILIDLFVLSLVSGFLCAIIWFENHIDLCWK